ncbi:MAG: universal stress protein [Nitrososphaeria archaeon]
MEKILVAFDGSEESRKCLSVAIQLAEAFDSLVTVLYVAGQSIVGPVVSPSVSVSSTEVQGSILPLPENMRNMMTREALRVLAETKEDTEKVWRKLDFAIVYGDAASEIIKEARKGYDLIVIGYRSKHSDMLSLGNVAEKVTKSAPCSVFIIK